MTDLFEKGTIFFNTIDYFQRLENQFVRGDYYEGTTSINNFSKSDNYKLTLTDSKTGKEIKISPTKIHLRQFLKDIKGNLFSMYCIKTPEVFEDNFKIDKRVKEFGSHFVIIKNVDKFLELICKELEKQNISFKGKLVDYYQKEKINGDVTLFDKTAEYEYQKEYRIVLYSDQIKPVIIQIGGLSEIAEMFEVGLIDKLKIDWIDNETV